MLKRGDLERQAAGLGSVLPCPKRILQSRFFGKIALQVEPYEPKKTPCSALAAQRGSHDEVEKISWRVEMDF